ncbi:hypothetical protein LTR62_006575 [Meristemomyces frigidus]|uniref:Molybdenum cofactor sulfurase n=1 Tax=Meristemomyces frigidus TaxID=1508187 RepID=A0AAN7TCM0_9PEZI|nr:hypothetical protein LTR62_006575 [Meristemomyces frigidus]
MDEGGPLHLKAAVAKLNMDEFQETPIPETSDDYDDYIQRMRKAEYPMLKDSLYLDHAGTTLYAKRLMDRFHQDMMSNLLGNPHSASPSSQRSMLEVENVRSQVLQYFNADPLGFDLVFVANATAGMKLMLEAMREQEGGFRFAYHVDSHTSLIGMREHATKTDCLRTDEEVECWLRNARSGCENGGTTLFAYPAQSNMHGRKLPLRWCSHEAGAHSKSYTLLDAAALMPTSPLDLSDAYASPDFTILSFNKMFGFPDLGALIVRKSAARVFDKRRYFGGGTVEMVLCVKEQWHARKSGPLHDRLEDGTLPIHSILALKSAMKVHKELFGTLTRTSMHTADLARRLHDGLVKLRHANGELVCSAYKHSTSSYNDPATQGPTMAFNLKDSRGKWISTTEVEKLAAIKDIHLRTGGVCNPGGVAQALGLEPWEMRENFSAGQRCGGEDDVRNGKPTGIVRVSLGAMSTKSDVIRFLAFLDDFFVDHTTTVNSISTVAPDLGSGWYIESLTVYPIKSCRGWQVPDNMEWEVRREGLAWDREWCIVHQVTGKALSQKQHPRMALIRPVLDFKLGVLRISGPGTKQEVTVPLSKDPTYLAQPHDFTSSNATVCGDAIKTRQYTSHSIADFLTSLLNVPCTLARFPSVDNSTLTSTTRHSKPHISPKTKNPSPPSTRDHHHHHPQPILLSNESPILTITRSSLNRLNETIKLHAGKAAHPSVFRANVILAEGNPINNTTAGGQEQPWAEDNWTGMRVLHPSSSSLSSSSSSAVLEMDFLSGCRRCQMVCIDQTTGERNQEPFVTLARTRRVEGRVVFGVHSALASASEEGKGKGVGGMVGVGDGVRVF